VVLRRTSAGAPLPPAPAPVAPAPAPALTLGFDGGFGKPWNVQAGAAGRATIESGPFGGKVARLEVRAGDLWNGTERTDLIANAADIGGISEGKRAFYRIRFKIEGYSPNAGWHTFGLEFHNQGLSGQANVYTSQSGWKNSPQFGLWTFGGDPNTVWQPGGYSWNKIDDQVRNGIWYDHIIAVTWSTSKASGRVSLWQNGSSTPVAEVIDDTLYYGQLAYPKLKNYRGTAAQYGARPTTTVWYSAMLVGTSFESVANGNPTAGVPAWS
jgi:hypothetical protein